LIELFLVPTIPYKKKIEKENHIYHTQSSRERVLSVKNILTIKEWIT